VQFSCKPAQFPDCSAVSSGKESTKEMAMILSSSGEPGGDRIGADWEIYEIGAIRPYAWSWRYRIGGKVARQSDIMYSSIRNAIDDAIAHGMNDPHNRCDIVLADATRIRYTDGMKLFDK
jgi:hypothetical protein